MKGWAMNIEIFCGPVKWQRGRQPELPFRATKNRIAQVMFNALIKALRDRWIRNTALLVVLCPTTSLINQKLINSFIN